MKDVFISYASEDRPLAQRVAEGLEQAGLSVWWDRNIQVGSEWDKTIEEALGKAKSVVVVWTAHAKHSRWVRAEAREALNQNKIVPVLVEANAMPLAFTGIQALQFLQWNGSAETQEFAVLLSVIKAQLSGKPVALPEASSTKASTIGKVVAAIGKVVAAVGIKTTLSAIGIVLLIASSQLPIDPEITVQVQTPRIEFSVLTDGKNMRLTENLAFDELTFEHVKHLSLSPRRFQVANPADFDERTNAFPTQAWQDLLTQSRTVRMESPEEGEVGEITIDSMGGRGSDLPQLDGIVLTQDSVVMVEVTPDNSIAVSIRGDGGSQRVAVSNIGGVELIQSGLVVQQGIPIPFSQDQELSYQAEFEDNSGTIVIEGQNSPFVVVLKEKGEEKKSLVSNKLPIQSVDFSMQDPGTGERKIPEGFSGKVSYRHPEGLPSHEIQKGSALGLDDLDHFEVTSITTDPTSHMLSVSLQGTAGSVKTGTRNNPHDLRPTLFDVIRYHPVWKEIRK